MTTEDAPTTPMGAEPPTDRSGDAPTTTRVLPRWRRILVGVLVVVGCVLTPLSVLGVWLDNTLLDTDEWVATVGPLAEKPAIQEAVAARVSNAVVQETNLEQRVRDLLPGQAKGLAGVVSAGAQDAVNNVATRVVASEQFAQLWDRVLRSAHTAVVAVLEGKGTESVSTRNGQIVLDLGAVVDEVKARLNDRGITLFDDVDTSRADRQIVIFESEDLRTAQDVVDLLDRSATVLPILTFVVFAAAVALSGNRRRTILRGAMGVALAMAILLTLFNLGRTAYLDALPASVNQDAATEVYDQVLTFLRGSVRTVFVVAIVVAIGAWLAGQGGLARRIRETVARALDRAPTDTRTPAPVAAFVAQSRTALRVVAVGLGIMVLVVLEHPSPLSVLVVVLLVLVALAVIEVLARAAPAPAAGVHRTSTTS